MFKKQPDGVEYYFSWPSGNARIVPNRSAKHGIMLRDRILYGVGGFLFLLAMLVEPGSPAGIALGVIFAIAMVGCFIERARYLSKLPKVPIEVTDNAEQQLRSIRGKRVLRMSTAQFDKAYIQEQQERRPGAGVLLTGGGLLITAGALYASLGDFETALPWFFSIPLAGAGLIVLYVGIRFLLAKN